MEQNPSYKKPLTLALILAGLSSLVYWFEFKKKPENQAAESLNKKVFALKEPSIRRISIFREGHSVVLECTNAKKECKPDSNTQWVLKEPLNAKADSSNVQSLMTNVLGMGGGDTVSLKEETPESRKDLLKSYRLDSESRATVPHVTVETDEGKKVTGYIGEQSPTSSNYYVLAEHDGQADENQVYLAPKFQVTATEQPITHWRDKRMVTIPQAEITGFTLNGKNGLIQVQRSSKDASSGWTVGKGDAALPADSDAIDTFLSGVVFLNAKSFEAEKKDSPEAKKRIAGLKEEASVELRSEKAKQTLRIYSRGFKDGKKTATVAYAVVDELDPVFSIDTTALDRVTRTADEFRMKKLLSVNDRGAISFAEFKSGAKKPGFPIQLKRENGEWKRTGPGAAIIPGNVNQLLDQLSGPVVKRFLPDQPVPASALQMEFGPGGRAESILRLSVWKIGPAVFAKNLNSSRKEIFQLDEAAAEVIPFEEKGLTVARAPKAPPPPADPKEFMEPEDMHEGESPKGGHDHTEHEEE